MTRYVGASLPGRIGTSKLPGRTGTSNHGERA